MAYIAIKPVRFDRRYSIGEIIPDAVVDPARAPKLREMGLIQASPEEAADAADGGDEVTTPAEPKEAADGPASAPARRKKAASKK